jgi:RES domain-containing protein
MASVGGVWWRHLRHGADPLALGDPPADGRWQRGAAVGALYLAQEEETAWAEWYRVLAELGMPPEHGLPRDLRRYRVELEGVVDLSSATALRARGLEGARPTQRQWPAFQELGEELWREGASGVLYESAARPGALALCVFAAEEGFPGLRPQGRARVFSAPPPVPRGLRT